MGKHVAPKCRAKNPETCSYHGKQNLDDMVKRGDVSAYMSHMEYRESKGMWGNRTIPLTFGLDTNEPRIIGNVGLQLLYKHMTPKTKERLENYNGKVDAWVAQGKDRDFAEMQREKDALVKGLKNAHTVWLGKDIVTSLWTNEEDRIHADIRMHLMVETFRRMPLETKIFR